MPAPSPHLRTYLGYADSLTFLHHVFNLIFNMFLYKYTYILSFSTMGQEFDKHSVQLFCQLLPLILAFNSNVYIQVCD